MAIQMKFDNTHNVIEPTLVLATRNGRKLGKLPAYNLVVRDGLNTYAELSFRVNRADCDAREDDGKFWGEIVDFKLVWVREWNRWFEIYVEIDETADTIKNVTAKSLGEAELSQINLYGIEINTETDISREDYEPTVLYRASRPQASLLTRITEKIPHYVIKHVDSTIADIQRTFTFDGISIYDAFCEIAEEIGCLFVLDCSMDADGRIVREINVYDLETNCLECGERGEFTESCPACDSTNLLMGYGDDTTIFVSTDNLADEITYTTDNGAVKNCFKLEAGDDLMTATVVNCNPNGSGYIWYISDAVKQDMSKALVEKLEQYDNDYVKYQTKYPITIPAGILASYNALVTKYKTEQNKLTPIASPLSGYIALMEAYYQTIDFYLYLNNKMMPPSVESGTTATAEANKLRASNLSPVAVRDLKICSSATADSAVLAMARLLVNKHYQVKLQDTAYTSGSWTGKFVVTNYAHEDDTATTGTITVKVNDDFESYVRQKISKAISQSLEDDDITDVVELFKLGDTAFANELKKYGLARLTSFYESCRCCLDVLTEQGAGNNKTWSGSGGVDLYTTLYVPYFNKLGALEKEIKVREDEIAVVLGTFDKDGRVATDGLQTILDRERDKIQDILDFQKYIGHDLWLEFSAYRREDTYQNDNYISDGLDNAELFDNARRFLAVAQKEIVKSATLQHSISATLKNLLVMPEFAPLLEHFEVGNWLRIRVDRRIYRLRLLEYEIDFDDLSHIDILFSDVTLAGDGMSDLNSVLKQASSLASSYDTTKRQAEMGADSKKWLDVWVQKGLDATNVNIVSNADNQNQTWDNHGILCREYDAVTDSYDDCQLKILNSTMAITDDNWKSIKTAVGRFHYIDPVTKKLTEAYGINAEVLIGKLIMGESLGIYTENNAMTFDRNGLSITNGTNSFTVNPNKDNLLVLSNDQDDILWVDSRGNLSIKGTLDGCDGTFSGKLSAATGSFKGSINVNDQFIVSESGEVTAKSGTFSGTVSGGSIDIGNGTFQVDKSGNITANRGTFKGELDGATGTFKGDISAATGMFTNGININNRFIVDSSGNMTASYGTLTGGKINIGDGNFKVDEYGNLTATSGTFSGTVKGATFKTSGGLDMMSGGKFTSNYLSLNGISIYDSVHRKTSFEVSTSGEVTIDGNIVLGDGTTINWATVKEVNSTSCDAYIEANKAVSAANTAAQSADKAAKSAKTAADSISGVKSTVEGWRYGSTTQINGRAIATDTLWVSRLMGGEVNLLTSSEDIAGTISITGSSSNPYVHGYAIDLSSNGALRLTSKNSSIFLQADKSAFIELHREGYITIGANNPVYSDPGLIPSYDGRYSLGEPSRYWKVIYADSDMINSSDRTKKKNIDYNVARYEDFYMRLKPTQYKFINGDSGRYHMGFISQDVEEALAESGLTSLDFAGFIKSPLEDEDGRPTGEYSYGLRYGEFVALNTYMIQKLYGEIEELKKKIGNA